MRNFFRSNTKKLLLTVKILSLVTAVLFAVYDCVLFCHYIRYGWKLSIYSFTDSLTLTLPAAVFAIYLIFFYSKKKYNFIVPIVFATLTLFIIERYVIYYLHFIFVYCSSLDLCAMLICSVSCIFFILAIVSFIRKNNRLLYPLIAASSSALFFVYEYICSLVSLFGNMFYIALILYLVAIIIFVLTDNLLPHVIKSEKIAKMKPARALRALQDNLELGAITEEEYQTQRAAIINRL